MKRLGVLLSGRGSNFLALHAATQDGRLAAEVGLVVSNREQAAGLRRARELGLAARHLAIRGDMAAWEETVAGMMDEARVDLVCLAGFMRVLGGELLDRYAGRILNVHPSLLPAFPGLDAQRQALDHGVKVTGCTVHFVDRGVDTGPIVVQQAVPVLDGDTEAELAARVLAAEHRSYVEAVKLVLDDKYVIAGRRVIGVP